MTIRKSTGNRLIAIGVLLLIVLRQDIWFWHDSTLWLGMLPVGLAWQLAISLAAAALWFAATCIAWPSDHEYRSPASAPPTSQPGNRADA